MSTCSIRVSDSSQQRFRLTAEEVMADRDARVVAEQNAVRENEASIARLREHGIVPNGELQSFICVNKGCVCEVPFKKKLFMQHLKKRTHNGLEPAVIGELWDCAQQCSGMFDERDNSMLEKYRMGGWGVGEPPTIIGLPVVKGRKCPRCDKLFEAENALRNHSKITHGETLSRGAIKNLDVVLCQSLARQTKGKKLYRCDAEKMCDGGSNSLEVNRAKEYDLGARLKRFDHGELVGEPTSAVGVSDREKGSFASLARCKEMLSLWSLSLVDGWNLRGLPGEEDGALYVLACKLTGLLKEYASEAHGLFREAGSFYSLLWDIGTSGVGEKKRRFKFTDRDRQGMEKAERYSRSVRCVILIACLVYVDREKYKNIEVPRDLRAGIEGLLGKDVGDKDSMLEKMHRVLFSIFFEHSSIGEGSKKLFASVIGACLCVGGSREDRVYVRRGKEVSPYLSGILYFVSICALMEMRKYTKEDYPGVAEAEIAKVLKPGAKARLTVFIELRSICAKVRMEENALHLFVKCDEHVRCGFYEGIEFSISMLGEAVRKMQDSVRSTILDSILFGSPLLSDVRKKCNTIYDDASCVVPGYWALSDPRNAQLVSECLKWVLSNVAEAHLRSVEAQKAWVSKVEDLVKELLSLVHLAGGAPGRGTELGSIGIRNTQDRQRGVYFAGWEVILVPTYTKTRNMRRGEMRFILRYMDRETSFLFKLFFF